ncbi:Transcription factor TFIID (or TATA-binding protein, TBP) [uncultured archaeon]|nr:Transcription factor TFIID (or TATA-binding protein, TBP) [uncultured archaeon]
MELSDYTGKPCRNKMAYEFLPKKELHVELGTAEREISTVATIEMSSKVLLMARMNNVTISLFPSGKLLVRGEREEEKAKKAAEKLVKALKESIK